MSTEISQPDAVSTLSAIDEIIRQRRGLTMPRKFRAALKLVHACGQTDTSFYNPQLQTIFQVPYIDEETLAIDVINATGSARITQIEGEGGRVTVSGDREIFRNICPEGTGSISDELFATVVTSRMLRTWQYMLHQQLGNKTEDGPYEVRTGVVQSTVPEKFFGNPVMTDVYRVLAGKSYLVTYSSGDGIPWAQTITTDSNFIAQEAGFVSIEQLLYRQGGMRTRYAINWDKWEGMERNVEALHGILSILDTMIQARGKAYAKQGIAVDTQFTARDIFAHLGRQESAQ